MKKAMWLAGGLLVATGGWSGAALAQGAQPPAETSPRASATAKSDWTAEGRVIKVGKHEVMISRQDRPNAEFEVKDSTRIRIRGAEGRVKDLTPGTEVRVRFEISGDDAIAQEIETR